MNAADFARGEQAIDWARRIHDPSFAEWDAHVAWLEADPRNADAFDAALVAMEDATAGLAASPVAASTMAVNDNAHGAGARGRRWVSRWGIGLGGALAASLVAIVAVPSFLHGGARTYRIEAAPGQSRTIALADGTTIALNGGSTVVLDRAAPRTATLVRGEAFFRVVHDEAHPFAVRAGDGLFRDVGTSFDVVRDAGEVRVSVREGAVMYDPDGAAVRLGGGQQIAIDAAGATIGQVDPAAVGGWREGRLSYRDAPLAAVAADLARSLGTSVTIDPALRDRRFSGVLIVDANRVRTVRRVASVMDVAIRRDGNGWQMTPLAR